MKIFKEGDTSNTPCNYCKNITPSTFKIIKKYTFQTDSKNDCIANNILLSVCDICDNINSIPQQSTKKINEAINN